jgi:hypothetical protein
MSQKSLDSTELPAPGQHSHCVLIPRDPEVIFAYWDYSKEDLARVRNASELKGEDVHCMLRLQTPSNDGLALELDVGFENKNCYLTVPRDNENYRVQIGLSAGKGQFFPLMQSNMAHTPPRSISKRNDLIWQDIDPRKQSVPYIEEEPKKSRKTRVYHLTVQDIRDYYRNIFTSLVRKGNLKNITWQKVDPKVEYPELKNAAYLGSSHG